MPRIAKKITIEELTEKLKDISILRTIPKHDIFSGVHVGNVEGDKVDIVSIQSKNELTFAVVSTMNDWETYPIYFIAYIDTQDRIRAFVPKNGNTYNPWTLTGFGGEQIANHSRHSIVQMPEQYYETDSETGLYKPSEQYKKEFEDTKLEENIDVMINEFYQFVKVEG